MHPYEMLRLLRERREERLIRIQQGTFYHQVAALQRDGRIEPVCVDRQGNRPERTTYAITAAGDDAVLEWIRAELPGIDNSAGFRIALAEAHNLDRGDVRALLGQRIDRLVAAHEDLSARLADAADRQVQRQFLVDLERERAIVAADAEWTRSLVAELADGGQDPSSAGLSWGIPTSPARADATPRKDSE